MGISLYPICFAWKSAVSEFDASKMAIEKRWIATLANQIEKISPDVFAKIMQEIFFEQILIYSDVTPWVFHYSQAALHGRAVYRNLMLVKWQLKKGALPLCLFALH